jgi:hypothetical protein
MIEPGPIRPRDLPPETPPQDGRTFDAVGAQPNRHPAYYWTGLMRETFVDAPRALMRVSRMRRQLRRSMGSRG